MRCTCSTRRINASAISEEEYNRQHSLLAYGLPQLTVEGAEPIDTIAVVLLKAGLHQLQELWLLWIIYCETEQSHVTFRTAHCLNIFSHLEQNRHCAANTPYVNLLCGVSWAGSVKPWTEQASQTVQHSFEKALTVNKSSALEQHVQKLLWEQGNISTIQSAMQSENLSH